MSIYRSIFAEPNFLTRFVFTFIALPLLSIGMLISYPFRILLFPFRLLIGLFTGTAGEQIKSLQESVKNYFNEVKSRGFFGGLAYILLTPLASALEFLFRRNVLYLSPICTQQPWEDNFRNISLDDGKDFQYYQDGDVSEDKKIVIYFSGSDSACGFDNTPYSKPSSRLPGLTIISPVRHSYHIDKNGDVKQIEEHNFPETIKRYTDFIAKLCQEHKIKPENLWLHGLSWGGAEASAVISDLKTRYNIDANGIIQSGSSTDVSKQVAHHTMMPAAFCNFLLSKDLKFPDYKEEISQTVDDKKRPEMYFIHGEKDGMVPIKHAKGEYDKALQSGRKAHFVPLENYGHEIDDKKMQQICTGIIMDEGMKGKIIIEHPDIKKTKMPPPTSLKSSTTELPTQEELKKCTEEFFNDLRNPAPFFNETTKLES